MCIMSCILACIDHRGTPENPARTCTLEAVEEEVCVSEAWKFCSTFSYSSAILFISHHFAVCIASGALHSVLREVQKKNEQPWR